jgi:hypothetical protein
MKKVRAQSKTLATEVIHAPLVVRILLTHLPNALHCLSLHSCPNNQPQPTNHNPLLSPYRRIRRTNFLSVHLIRYYGISGTVGSGADNHCCGTDPSLFSQVKELRQTKEAQRQFAMGKMPDYSSSGNTRLGTDLKWTMSNQPTTKLGAAFWSTKHGRALIRYRLEELEDDRFLSARNTSQTLKTDLAEIIASDYLSKPVAFEQLTQFMDAVLVSGDGEFARWEHLYA